jgi:predicted nucleotidyltransferase
MSKTVKIKAQHQLPAALPMLKRLCARHKRVVALWLFGSLTDGYAHEQSDIDLAVLWDDAPTFQAELDFELAVCHALGTERVDVLHLNRAPLELRFRAISGRLLYERAVVRVSDFIERISSGHQDYQFVERQFNEDYWQGIKQDYGAFPQCASASVSRR